MFGIRVIVWLLVAWGWLMLAPVCACAQAPAEPAESDDRWPLERVTLNDGRSYRGLIKSVGETTIEFAEVRRLPGKPMFVTILPLDRAAIVRVERLKESERAVLSQRIQRFANRALFEAGRRETIVLTPIGTGPDRRLLYQGTWFELESTADSQITRQFIVRLEQMFLAFRQLLPPRLAAQPAEPLRVLLFGTLAGYQQYLQQSGIPLRNPAYYSPAERLVVVGSDVGQVAERNAALQRQHSELRQQLEEERRKQDFLLQDAEAKFKAQEGTATQWKPIAAAARAKLAKQQAERLSELSQADRLNEQTFAAEMELTLARLYHETFHAYLDDYVYGERGYAVPRWLNEGLAQIFEGGLLEADTLRIDAPAADRLLQLQADLRGKSPLKLADLLSAEQTAFLVPHSEAGQSSQRHYLYSWGLAWYLTFDQSLLGTSQLDGYVKTTVSDQSPQERFETLVNLPLDQFEARWRKAMLALKPAGK